MNWSVFFAHLPDGDTAWWQTLISGLALTIAAAAGAAVVALVLGTLVGIARVATSRAARTLAAVYVELFRDIPLLVQFFIWYFVIPVAIPPLEAFVAELDPTLFQLATAIVCLGLFTAARVAEQVRAGLQAQARGMALAARALGLTAPQAYRHVLLPVAFRTILPPLTSELMNLIKNTAVAYSIGLTELFFRTREMGEMTFAYFQAFAAATVLYAVLALTANRVMGMIDRRTRRPGMAHGAS